MKRSLALAVVAVVLLTAPLIAFADSTYLPAVLRAGRVGPPSVSRKVHGLDFSPYLDGQDPNAGSQISEEQLRARMGRVAPYTEWIRTFGCTDGLEKAGLVAHELGLKAALGAWLSGDDAANEAQIANLIAAGKAGQVDMAIVGSETLLRGDVTEAELIGYLSRVKLALPDIPVTTADIYGEWLSRPALVAAADVVFVNCYPFWEGTEVGRAMASLHGMHQRVVAAAGGKPVVLSESGWPSCGSALGDAVPSPQNASAYFLNFVSWARAEGVDYFYFEAFDEAWKVRDEGALGACWGVWDADGNLKPGMQDVFDGETVADNWSGDTVVGGPGTPTVTLTYVPPYGTSEWLRGQVQHVSPSGYVLAVYIQVEGRWWTKPYSASPTTVIWPDGSWECDIVTGGSDQNATAVVVHLVPATYTPPTMLGGPALPAELDANAVAKVDATRHP